MARPMGSRNITRVDVHRILKEHDCNPFEGMIRIGRAAEASGDLNLAGGMYRELAKYIAPQLKSTEHSGSMNGAISIQVITGVPIITD